MAYEKEKGMSEEDFNKKLEMFETTDAKIKFLEEYENDIEKLPKKTQINFYKKLADFSITQDEPEKAIEYTKKVDPLIGEMFEEMFYKKNLDSKKFKGYLRDFISGGFSLNNFFDKKESHYEPFQNAFIQYELKYPKEALKIKRRVKKLEEQN